MTTFEIDTSLHALISTPFLGLTWISHTTLTRHPTWYRQGFDVIRRSHDNSILWHKTTITRAWRCHDTNTDTTVTWYCYMTEKSMSLVKQDIDNSNRQKMNKGIQTINITNNSSNWIYISTRAHSGKLKKITWQALTPRMKLCTQKLRFSELDITIRRTKVKRLLNEGD